MRFSAILVTLFCFLNNAFALDVPPGGIDVCGNIPLQGHAGAGVGRVEKRERGVRIAIEHPDPAKAYTAQLTAPIGGSIRKGERVLAVIKARVEGAAEPGEVIAKLQLNGAPYTAFAATANVAIFSDWTEQPVVFTADAEIAEGTAAVVLLCGQKKQSIEVESVRILKYPATMEIGSFPRLRLLKRTYEGRELDAPWRKAALERIEQQRKADLSLVVKGADGLPISNSDVKLSLRRHAFGFGSAVIAKRLVGKSEEDRHYQEIVDRLFSVVVFENDLKDGNWAPDFKAERQARRNEELNGAFAWLEARQIGVRGHYLMQVAIPFNLHGIKDDEVIRDRILSSVKQRISFVGDRVIEWDVINHPIAWNGAEMLNKRAGLKQIDRETFRLARSLTALPFFVNEDQVFRPGPQCDETFEYIKALNEAGLTVAGLGNQAHFHESYLPSPEHLLAITDRFAKIVPHQAITEFDVITTEDEELAADYTRDVLIAVFSHPAYSSFLLWGFWEGTHWKPEAASWNKDWTIRKRGEVLEEWIGHRWHTELTVKSDATGLVHWRGFPGWYELRVGDQTPILLEAK